MECIEFNETDMLRQGDAFRWVHQIPPWQSVGILVTADCDLLSKQKPFINYVPLIGLSDYLTLFLARAEMGKQAGLWLNDLHARIETLRRKYRPDSEPFTREVVEAELIMRRSANDILTTLGVTSQDDANRFLTKAERQLPILQSISSIRGDDLRTLRDAMTTWCNLLEVNVGTRDQAKEKLAEKVRSHLSSLPDDVFFVSDIPGDDVRSGHMAMLRYIREIKHDRLFQSPGECRLRGGDAYRVARLAPRFLYHMTRKLAAIFSDIGLPDEYDHNRVALGHLVVNMAIP
jgi:hypothetical protein